MILNFMQKLKIIKWNNSENKVKKILVLIKHMNDTKNFKFNKNNVLKSIMIIIKSSMKLNKC